MADAVVSPRIGLVLIDGSNDTWTPDRATWVDQIVLTATAAGSFVFELDTTELTITTGANDLTKVIPINRPLTRIYMSAEPTNGELYAFMGAGTR